MIFCMLYPRKKSCSFQLSVVQHVKVQAKFFHYKIIWNAIMSWFNTVEINLELYIKTFYTKNKGLYIILPLFEIFLVSLLTIQFAEFFYQQYLQKELSKSFFSYIKISNATESEDFLSVGFDQACLHLSIVTRGASRFTDQLNICVE